MKLSLRQKELKDKRKSLYLDIYSDGKRKYEYLNLYLEPEKRGDKTTKEKNEELIELANKIKAKREIELANFEKGFIPKNQSKINFITYFESVANKKQDTTKKTYLQCLAYIKKFAKNSITINDFDSKTIENFIEFLKNENLHINTVELYITKLKFIIRQAIKDKLIIENPFLNIEQIKTKTKKRKYLTLDEINQLLETEIDYTQIKYAFLFACFTGLRLSEIEKLTWKEIQNDRIELRQMETDVNVYLEISEPAKQVLEKLEKKGEKVFQLGNRSLLRKRLKNWVERANIDKNVSFHTSRHSFAVNYLTLGGDIFILKELLGHSLLETTLVYADIISERNKQAVKLFPKINI